MPRADRSVPTAAPPRHEDRAHDERHRPDSRRLLVLGRLAHLPVPIVEGVGEGGVHLGPVERGEGDDGPPPHGRLVVGGGVEDGGQAGVGAEGPEGGDRRFPHEGVGMVTGQRAQPGHDVGPRLLTLAAGECRHLDDPDSASASASSKETSG